jgi:hypothetical protein
MKTYIFTIENSQHQLQDVVKIEARNHLKAWDGFWGKVSNVPSDYFCGISSYKTVEEAWTEEG